ncbi:hypothetical protein EIN_171580, partial [Entamoeba invadens IP1]
SIWSFELTQDVVIIIQIQNVFKRYGIPLLTFEKLKEIGTVLSFDKIDEIYEYKNIKGWKLLPLETQLIMTLRIDFDKKEIRKLKL